MPACVITIVLFTFIPYLGKNHKQGTGQFGKTHKDNFSLINNSVYLSCFLVFPGDQLIDRVSENTSSFYRTVIHTAPAEPAFVRKGDQRMLAFFRVRHQHIRPAHLNACIAADTLVRKNNWRRRNIVSADKSITSHDCTSLSLQQFSS